MPEGRRFTVRLQPTVVRALEDAGRALGIGDAQAMIYHCINLGLQQVSLIVGQKQQTSVLEKLIEAAEGKDIQRDSGAVLDVIGGTVTPRSVTSFGTGNPSGFKSRKGHKGGHHAS